MTLLDGIWAKFGQFGIFWKQNYHCLIVHMRIVVAFVCSSPITGYVCYLILKCPPLCRIPYGGTDLTQWRTQFKERNFISARQAARKTVFRPNFLCQKTCIHKYITC